MSTQESTPIILHGDPEHSGIRSIVIVILIGGLIIGFLIVQLLLQLLAANSMLIEFSFALSCMGSIPIALGLAYMMETILKQRWPSGVYLAIEGNRLRLVNERNKENREATINWTRRLNQTRWYFTLTGYPKAGREKRLSSNWVCLACEVQQNDIRINVYTYMPPDNASSWINNANQSESFQEIVPAMLYEENRRRFRMGVPTRPEISNEMLTSKNGRYWLAERRRWQHGIELSADDFITFLQSIPQPMDIS